MLGRTNTGGGGGGGGLNFQVVGGTVAPSNPKENTIWINTATKITSWIFSAKEPENLAEGTVWITTSASSTVAFNAIKKNGIEVYPFSAKQYIGSALVDVEAQIYQNGEWVEMLSDLVFFENGKFNTAVFGEISGNYTINDDGTFRAYTNNPISSTTLVDMSPYSKFHFEIIKYNYSNPIVTLTNASGATVATFGRYTAVGVYTGDVSAINEPVKINISMASNSGSGNSDLNNIKFLK